MLLLIIYIKLRDFMKKLFLLIFIISNYANAFGDFDKLIENIGEELKKQQENKPKQEVQIPTTSTSSITTNTSSSKECKYLEIELNENEQIGCADSDDWEYIDAGVGLIRGEENKKAAIKLALVNALKKNKPFTEINGIINTEFANQLLTNSSYGAIAGYEIISEKNDAIAAMGQQPNLSQAKWSYTLKVKINKNIPIEKVKQFEKDMRIIYSSSASYIIPGKKQPSNAEEAKAKALDQAIVDYFQLRNSQRVLLPGNKLQQKWLDKNYGLYEKYEVLDSYIDPFMKIPVVKLKVFMSDYEKHPNKKIIDQDFKTAAPHDAYSLEVKRGIGMTLKATELVGEAVGAKKSHFDNQDQEASFILVGSRLGDDGVDRKSMVVDDIRRKQIVEILNSEPDLNPEALALFDKGYQADKLALKIINNADQKLSERKKTGTAEDNQGLADISKKLQALGKRTSVLAPAIDKYNATKKRNPAEDKAFEKSLEEETIEDLFADEAKNSQSENEDLKKP